MDFDSPRPTEAMEILIWKDKAWQVYPEGAVRRIAGARRTTAARALTPPVRPVRSQPSPHASRTRPALSGAARRVR